MSDDRTIEKITLAALGLASPEETARVRDILSQHSELASHSAAAQWMAENWRPLYSRRKRIFDALIGTLFLLASLPIMIIVSALLVANDWGFPLYRRSITGKGGVQLTIYEFLCMYHPNSRRMKRRMEAVPSHFDGPAFDVNVDPRFTRVGNWVRRLNLDGLPSLINVLRNQISLVGPSPEYYITSTYIAESHPEYFKRFAVFPGLFSLRNVLLGDSAEASWSTLDAALIDLYYVRNASMSLDIRILFASMLTLLRIPRSLAMKICGLPTMQFIRQAESTAEPEMINAYGRFDFIYQNVLQPSNPRVSPTPAEN